MSKERFTPQYQRIFEDLKSKIDEGAYAPGDQLPFERELCELYSVERITVRKSLEMLVQEGLIEKHAGRGSFVKRKVSALERPISTTILFVMKKNQNDIESNTSAFNAQLFFPMERVCSDHGFSLLYTGLAQNDDIGDFILRHGIAGVFLVSTLPESVYDQVAEMRVPSICINHAHNRLTSVMPDNVSGVSAAVDRLFELGHSRIAYINGMPGAMNAIERFDSYSMSLFRHGISLRQDWIVDGEWTYNGGFNAMNAMLSSLASSDYPTAVVAASDMMAIGCIDAIKRHGFSVPEDFSVIGFDGIDMGKFCTPQLTSVLTDPGAMARIAFDHLRRIMDRRESEGDRYVIRLPAPLIDRQSTAAPRDAIAS